MSYIRKADPDILFLWVFGGVIGWIYFGAQLLVHLWY